MIQNSRILKIIKLLMLAESPNNNEVAIAFRTASKMMREEGMTWDSLFSKNLSSCSVKSRQAHPASDKSTKETPTTASLHKIFYYLKHFAKLTPVEELLVREAHDVWRKGAQLNKSQEDFLHGLFEEQGCA